MPSIRPFTFGNLKRMTRAQAALEASVTTWLGGRPLAPELAGELAALLEKYLKEPCKVVPPDLRSVARRDLATLLPETGCFVIVGAAPGDKKLVVDLDMGLASFAVERLLGGTGESERILRPLTEVEEGVLSFLLLEALALFGEGLATGNELVLTLDCFASKVDEVQRFVDAESDFVLLGVRVSAGKHVGYARILLPGSLVTERFGKLVPQVGATAAARSSMEALVEGLADMPVTGRVELARLPDLGADDVAELEPGDIVVLEGHPLTRTPEGLEGTVVVRVGAGVNGGLRCRLVPGEPQRIEIVEIVVQEHPAEDVMADEGAEDVAGGESLAEAEGLLRDVAAPVVVELGRIRMNAAQLVRLKKGQILRLPRGPNDPVDLVVNGKVFARGELIDVEGELGVRLVQIVGAG